MQTRLGLTGLTTLALFACEPAERAPEVDRPAERAEPISIVRADADIQREERTVAEPLDKTVLFVGSSTALDPTAIVMLKDALSQSAFQGDGGIRVSGHTDSAGTDSANLKVSQQRAEAVAAWFIDQGIDPDRITIIAFGEQNPAEPNALPDGSENEAGRAANRRVEVTTSIVRDAPVPGESADLPSLIEQVATED